jgi:ankyrin repeat protein
MGCTALHWAASHGHEAAVRVLVELGASLYTTCTDGFTALDLAGMEGHPQVVHVLKRMGAGRSAPELTDTDTSS